MFPRVLRLVDTRAFDRIFKHGTWVRGKYFSVRYLRTQPGGGKIGFVISKKVTKSAVGRNRIKRQLRSVLQTTLKKAPFSHIIERYYLLVVVHKWTGPVSYAELTQDATHILTRFPPKEGKS